MNSLRNDFKNFFLKTKIIKDNFKISMIILALLIVFFLIAGLLMWNQYQDLYEDEYRFDNKSCG